MKLLRTRKSLAVSLLATCLALTMAAATASADRGRGNAFGWWKKGKPSADRPGPMVPEPTGALLFAAGLFAVHAAGRSRRPS